MENEVRPSAAEAAAALAAAAEARSTMAAAVPPTPWYAPAYGAVVAVFVTASWLHGAGHGVAAFGALAAYLTLLTALVASYQRSARMWPRLEGPRAVTAAVAVGALLAACLGTAWLAGRNGLPWLGAAAVAAAGVGAALLSRASDRGWARDHTP